MLLCPTNKTFSRVHLKRFNLTCLLFTENYSSFNREGLHDNSNNKKNIATHMEVKKFQTSHSARLFFMYIKNNTKKLHEWPASEEKKRRRRSKTCTLHFTKMVVYQPEFMCTWTLFFSYFFSYVYKHARLKIVTIN